MRNRFLFVAVAALTLVPSIAFAATGDPLPEYGTDGIVTISGDGGPHWLGDMTVHETGEIVLTGSTVGGGSGERALWLGTINPDGSVVSELLAGVLEFPYEHVSSIAIADDGSIFLAGAFGGLDGVDVQAFVGKLLSDGTPWAAIHPQTPIVVPMRL